jgi:hypothetical protein
VEVDSLLVVRIMVFQLEELWPAIQATFPVDLSLQGQVELDLVDVQLLAVLHRINQDRLKRPQEQHVVL